MVPGKSSEREMLGNGTESKGSAVKRSKGSHITQEGTAPKRAKLNTPSNSEMPRSSCIAKAADVATRSAAMKKKLKKKASAKNGGGESSQDQSQSSVPGDTACTETPAAEPHGDAHMATMDLAECSKPTMPSKKNETRPTDQDDQNTSQFSSSHPTPQQNVLSTKQQALPRLRLPLTAFKEKDDSTTMSQDRTSHLTAKSDGIRPSFSRAAPGEDLAKIKLLRQSDNRKVAAQAELEMDQAIQERRRLKRLKRAQRQGHAAATSGQSESFEGRKTTDMAAMQTETERDAASAALQYLHNWKSDPHNWKFQKVRQTFLLKYMYDPYKISKADFKLLLEYLDGLKGQVRQVTGEAAEKMLEELASENAPSSGADSKAPTADVIRQIKMFRAKKVAQCLV